jgi:ligand-binding sensor domain-containing protein/signal transduction histidine kinase
MRHRVSMGWPTVLILSVALPALLEGELIPVRTYTTADGLAANRVERIVADSRGFLWFCTAEGLSRFDGTRFTTYSLAEGLPHQTIRSVLETRSGDHWIGTPRGVSLITAAGRQSRFTNFRIGADALANRVGPLLESRSGAIRAGTAGGVFEWTDPRNVHRLESNGIERLGITAMTETGDGLWVGTTTGLYLLGPHGILQSFKPDNGMPGQWVESLLVDSKGRVWVAMRGGLVLLRQSAPGHWITVKSFTSDSGLASPIALLEASDGTLWVGSTEGISRLMLDAAEPKVIQRMTRAQGLIDRFVISLAEDQAGNVWAGSEGAGVMRIDRRGFSTYKEQDGLPSDRVFSVFGDRAGSLVAVTWMGFSNRRSVDVFDGTRFHIAEPGVLSDQPSWGWNQIMLQSRKREWWAATRAGLCRYPPMSAGQLNGLKPESCYATDTDIFRIFEDSKGGVWAAGQVPAGGRLLRWDPASGTVAFFPLPKSLGEDRDELVTTFEEDRQGAIWMGLYRGGLYRFDGHGFRVFKSSDGVPEGFVYALMMDGSGLWIATEGGLGRLRDPSADHPLIEVYNTARGMSSNMIYCLVDDAEGRVYAGTGKGVDRLNPKTGAIRHLSTANGLAHGELNGAYRDRSGTLWFATTQGLSRLAVDHEHRSSKPRVLITGLRVGGAEYRVSELGETLVSGLEVQPSKNQLQVEFAGLYYEPGDILRYSYRLDGADSAWSAPGTLTTVNYASVNSGTYRFLVKGVTADGVESEPAEIAFRVLPPVWKRWWFLSLAAVLSAGMVIAAHHYRMAQVLNLERMRTAIATDLHDDIGASLSQIAILSDVARVRAGANGMLGEPLEHIAALARELVDSMSDIVWSIRSEPHGMDSLIRRMREFALDLLVSRGIDFRFRTPGPCADIDLSLHARRQLFLIFKECLHNIARHSGCATVTVELKVEHAEIRLTVADDGQGFDPASAPPCSPGGTGLIGMRRRTESLRGKMQLESMPGQGCSVSIVFPIRGGVHIRT